MINDKKELAYYLECDRIALGRERKKPPFIGDPIWKFERLMRRLEYYKNPLFRLILRWRYHHMSIRLGFSIPINTFGPGLAIVHYGTIIVSTGARIGANCRIHAGVNIGANAGSTKAAVIGDNVYIGPGAKIVGEVSIGTDAVIGANAVVVSDVAPKCTVGGVPARVISTNDSSVHLIKATEVVNKTND